MKNIKKHLSAALAALLAAAMLAGCGKSNTEANTPKVDIADNSVDFVKNMKLGWNLGNTLDATGSGRLQKSLLTS